MKAAYSQEAQKIKVKGAQIFPLILHPLPTAGYAPFEQLSAVWSGFSLNLPKSDLDYFTASLYESPVASGADPTR